MKQIHALLLDMDGTLVDAFEPIVYALNQTLTEFGLPTLSEQEVRRHTGRGECSMISLFGEHREAAAKRFLELHDQRLFDIRPLEGAESLLQSLRRKRMKTAIVTSKSQIRAERQLQHLGWVPYFDAVIGLDGERRQKPDPHTLLLASEALGTPPEACIMVGDGVADMKAACSARMTGAGLVGHFSEGELREAGASICFHGLSEVESWLCQLID